jgi:hypothetical protein
VGYRSDVVIRIALRAGYKCEMCSREVPKVTKGQRRVLFHAHSVLTLHGVESKEFPGMFTATSPPDGHKIMKGKLLPMYGFQVFSLDRPHVDETAPKDDGFFLCNNCHVGIHAIAFNETRLKIVNAAKRNPTPYDLEKISLDLILNRKRF